MKNKKNHMKIFITILFVFGFIILNVATHAAAQEKPVEADAAFDRLKVNIDKAKEQVIALGDRLRDAKKWAEEVDAEYEELYVSLRELKEPLEESMVALDDYIAIMDGYIKEARKLADEAKNPNDQKFFMEDAEYWEEQVRKTIEMKGKLEKQGKGLDRRVALLDENKIKVKRIRLRGRHEATLAIMETLIGELTKVNEDMDVLLSVTKSASELVVDIKKP